MLLRVLHLHRVQLGKNLAIGLCWLGLVPCTQGTRASHTCLHHHFPSRYQSWYPLRSFSRVVLALLVRQTSNLMVFLPLTAFADQTAAAVLPSHTPVVASEERMVAGFPALVFMPPRLVSFTCRFHFFTPRVTFYQHSSFMLVGLALLLSLHLHVFGRCVQRSPVFFSSVRVGHERSEVLSQTAKRVYSYDASNVFNRCCFAIDSYLTLPNLSTLYQMMPSRMFLSIFLIARLTWHS